MTQSSKSAPGQFAAAIRRADPRSRATANPAVQASGIHHGHEIDIPGPTQLVRPEVAGDIAGLLAPGAAKNADGTERAD